MATDMPPEHAMVFDIPESMVNDWGIHEETGWTGAFTRKSASGAIPNGTSIRKTQSQEGDTRPVGARGVVLGSVNHPQLGLAYFIEWEERPRLAVFTVGWKIGE